MKPLTPHQRRAVDELMEYFRLDESEVMRRLGDAWLNYLARWHAFNPYDQDKQFAKWYDRTNQWYSEPEVHIFEQTNFRYFVQEDLARVPAGETERYLENIRGRVLDFGCGVARFSLQALEDRRCEKVHLFDASQSMHSFLIFLFYTRKLWDAQVVYDFSSYIYDTIIATDVLEHIPDPIGLCRKLKYHLNTGGKIIVSAPFYELTSPAHLKMHQHLSAPEVLELAGFTKDQYVDLTR